MTTGSKRGRKSQSPPKEQEQQVEEQATASTVVPAGKVASSREEKRNMSEVASIIEYEDDLSNAEAPVPLPKGDYVARIRGAEKKLNKAGDREYINVTFHIDAEQYPADYASDGDPDGVVLSYGRLSPENTQKARWQMRKFCESIGAELSSKLNLNDWLDKTALVTVINEKYEGVDQAKISKVGAA
jgi:hypothetical protein